MNSARIAALLEPFLDDQASDDLTARISTYIDILLRWNARVNLTAIRDPDEIVTRHFGESLFAARLLFPETAHVGTAALGCPAEQSSAEKDSSTARPTPAAEPREDAAQGVSPRSVPRIEQAPKGRKITLADLGSGAGFPGIAIKLWAPDASVTLIESNHKKATFLREIVRALTLTDIDIQNVRAETLPPTSFQIVTLRAVERFDDTLPIAARLVQPGGRLALLIGSSQLDRSYLTFPQFEWSAPISIPASDSRIVAIGHVTRE